MTAAITGRGVVFRHLNHGKLDLLKRELLAHPPHQIHASRIRLIDGTQLNLHRLLGELGKGFLHLPVESEGEVGIELFLKLKELGISTRPGTTLIHREDQSIRFGIVSQRIENAGMFESVVHAGFT